MWSGESCCFSLYGDPLHLLAQTWHFKSCAAAWASPLSASFSHTSPLLHRALMVVAITCARHAGCTRSALPCILRLLLLEGSAPG